MAAAAGVQRSQAERPPFTPGKKYTILNANSPRAMGLEVTYIGPDPEPVPAAKDNHLFKRYDGSIAEIQTGDPNYGIRGLYIQHSGNAGGRRKSRRSKRSKRSHRKTKRRHH